MERKALALPKQYPVDLNGKGFITEMQHKVNFECAQFNTIGPVELISTVTVQSLREFQHVAAVERSFSKLKLIKNFLKSTMWIWPC